MAVVIYAPHKDGLHDGSIQKQTMAFLKKLFQDDTLPGPAHRADPGCDRRQGAHRSGQRHVSGRALQGAVVRRCAALHLHRRLAARRGHQHRREGSAQDQPGQRARRADAGGHDRVSRRSSARPRLRVRRRSRPSLRRAAQPLLESVSAGIGLDRLTEELGLDADLAAHALAATNRGRAARARRLTPSNGKAWPWSSSPRAPPSSRCGRACRSTRSAEIDEEASEDDKLLAALKTPAARDAVRLDRGRRGAAAVHRGRRLRRLAGLPAPRAAQVRRGALQRPLPALGRSRHRQDGGAAAPCAVARQARPAGADRADDLHPRRWPRR